MQRMNIANLLMRTAKTFPDHPALALGRRTVATYREFSDASMSLANRLRNDYRLEAGDTVALIMKNCPEYWIALFAVWHAGLTAVPVNAKLHPNEFRYILENSRATLCFATNALCADLNGVTSGLSGFEALIDVESPAFSDLLTGDRLPIQTVAPTDIAWLFYTSGTTGQPKGAMLSHRNLLAAVMNYFADVDVPDLGDAIIHAAPQTHGSGLYGLPLIAKGGIQVTPSSGGFDPGEILQLIEYYPGSCFFFAPTMITRLMAHPALKDFDMSNLKLITYGGAPMYEADIRAALKAFGPVFVQIFGQGEAPMTITGLPKYHLRDIDHPHYAHRIASVGVERTDVEVRIFDDQDNELAIGEIGEIVLRGDVVMEGYWHNETATKEALRGGWLHTGDMGCFDRHGFLTLKDRSKDMIISGGSNIYPREVEEILLTHPGVGEVSVIGRPHPDWGEEVVAFIVKKQDEEISEAALDGLCLAEIARFKRPKAYYFLAELPKNNYGKVLKTSLRKSLEP